MDTVAIGKLERRALLNMLRKFVAAVDDVGERRALVNLMRRLELAE